LPAEGGDNLGVVGHRLLPKPPTVRASKLRLWVLDGRWPIGVGIRWDGVTLRAQLAEIFVTKASVLVPLIRRWNARVVVGKLP
jgi:hypothetical protein